MLYEPKMPLVAQPPLEIERKWLVSLDRLPELPGVGTEISQGYFDIYRVRDAGGYRYVTIKSGCGLVRTEIEVHLTDADFQKLWALVEAMLTKTRYVIPCGDYDAELDVYHDSLTGLVTVEVEFPSVEEAESFQAPSWFGEDVTLDERYTNYSLAWEGLP